jgi:hypothetical protein
MSGSAAAAPSHSLRRIPITLIHRRGYRPVGQGRAPADPGRRMSAKPPPSKRSHTYDHDFAGLKILKKWQFGHR